MQNPINTAPIQQFIQQVKAADLSQQREIKLDIKTAKNLVYCLAEINAKLLEDYDQLLNKVMQGTGQVISVQMDGGGFK
jgi:deoxyadenosine/deoxycytidine kinase